MTFSSNPRAMVGLDAALFLVPLTLVWYLTWFFSTELGSSMRPLLVQGMLSFPLLMASAVVIAGLMFELGQGSAMSSSEAVNWLPVTPSEYVAASTISTATLYSAFLAVAGGAIFPLASSSGLLEVWTLTMLLSILGLFLGASVIEILRAATNRVSSVVYRRGRAGLVARLIALVLLMVLFSLFFQPTVLYWVLGWIKSGVEAAKVVPIVWPSLALISMAGDDFGGAIVFSLASILFALLIYAAAVLLRRRYWSPIPISVSVGSSRGYTPGLTGALSVGLNPLEYALALKEFRALVRKKDMSRYLAIPIAISMVFLLPVLLSGDASGGAPVILLAAIIPYFVPLLFSSISVGQEGPSVATLLSIPLSPTELMKGKLTPALVISGVATAAVIVLAQLISPLRLLDVFAVTVAASMLILTNGFIGLGVGARWPDYTAGKSTYVAMKGNIVGFALAGLTTLAVSLPVALHLFLGTGVEDGVSQAFGLLPMMLASLGAGGLAIYLSYKFCKRGAEALLTGLEV